MRPAFERRLIETRLAQHRAGKLDMFGFAIVRGAGKREFLIAEAESIGRTAFDQRKRLDHLHSRTWEDRPSDIADLDNRLAARVEYSDRTAMHALDEAAADDFDKHGICHNGDSLRRASFVSDPHEDGHALLSRRGEKNRVNDRDFRAAAAGVTLPRAAPPTESRRRPKACGH